MVRSFFPAAGSLTVVLVPCGGINPYTLTAKLVLARIGESDPSKDDAWPGQPVWSPAQGVKTDLATKISVG